jgi:hypothetical protein
MAPEYDFSGGVRGKYAKRFQTAALKDVIVLEPELRRVFPNSAAVNEALRTLMRIADAAPSRPKRRKAG